MLVAANLITSGVCDGTANLPDFDGIVVIFRRLSPEVFVPAILQEKIEYHAIGRTTLHPYCAVCARVDLYANE